MPRRPRWRPLGRASPAWPLPLPRLQPRPPPAPLAWPPAEAAGLAGVPGPAWPAAAGPGPGRAPRSVPRRARRRVRARAPPIRAGASRPAPARSTGLTERRVRPRQRGRRRSRFLGRFPARCELRAGCGARRALRQGPDLSHPGRSARVQPTTRRPWPPGRRHRRSTRVPRCGECALHPVRVERRLHRARRSSPRAWPPGAPRD